MEYRAQVFRNVADGVERWKAFVVTIPAISAEAESREAVLEEIRRQLADITTSEITTVPGPVPEKVVEGDGLELDLRLSKMGHRHSLVAGWALLSSISSKWKKNSKSKVLSCSRTSLIVEI